MTELITALTSYTLTELLLIALFGYVVLVSFVFFWRQKRLISQMSKSQLELEAQHHKEQEHFLERQIADFRLKLMQQSAELNEKQQQALYHHQHALQQTLQRHQQHFTENQLKSVEQLTQQLNSTSRANREELANNIAKLTESTDKRLMEISGQVDKRLAEGFDKTTKTFNDILKRLALIDDAQKKITELSTNVVSLQEVLADKRSRGAFGEVQLNSLIRNVLPESQFSLQHTLSNGKVADCILFLPDPTGNVVIDAKFPLESYRTMTDISADGLARKEATKQFKLDIKKHISDIASKYLIEHETAEGAVMFIPAEAVFAEIHAHHNDLVDAANKQRVWLASPTTLMAILTTARAVIKDEATRKQVHIIQAHLGELSVDFDRFKGRFNNLARHIDQAASDVKQIHTSADKISKRFTKIERVDLVDENNSVVKAQPLSDTNV